MTVLHVYNMHVCGVHSLKVCVCMHACVCVCVRVSLCLLDTKKMLNEVLSCVYVISRVYCALGCVYILLTLFLFFTECFGLTLS